MVTVDDSALRLARSKSGRPRMDSYEGGALSVRVADYIVAMPDRTCTLNGKSSMLWRPRNPDRNSNIK